MNNDFYSQQLINELSQFLGLAEKAAINDHTELCCKLKTADDGYMYDINYLNRQRAAYCILLNNITISEDILSALLEEEIISRENDPFSGTSDALNIFTLMLLEYNADNRYEPLFTRAKNANFDCECGYDPHSARLHRMYPKQLSEYSPKACISIADELQLHTLHQTLCIQFLHDYPPAVRNDLEYACMLNISLGRENENIPYRKMLLTESVKSGDNWSIAADSSSLIKLLISQEEYSEALTVINTYQKYLMMIDGWYECGLGRDFFEYIAALICNIPENSLSLWKKWRKYILKYPSRMSTDCITKCISAAHKISDESAANKLIRSYSHNHIKFWEEMK